MLPAARDLDKSSCPQHGGGLSVARQEDVIANSRRLSTVQCTCACMGPPDYIVTGSGTVLVHNAPAARATDRTMHGGVVAVGSSNVFIGGPRVGATLGAPGTAEDCCTALNQSRVRGDAHQSYNNCGVESVRLLLRGKYGQVESEQQLLDEAISEDDASGWLADLLDEKPGATTAGDQVAILDRHGVPATRIDNSPNAIAQAVAEGKGVSSGHDAGVLWDNPKYNGTGHAIVVTGVEYDENGKPAAFITADSGIGSCRRSVPADRFSESLLRWGQKAVATREPLWPNARRTP